VHDCFTADRDGCWSKTRLCDRGTAWKEILAGTFDLGGDLPVTLTGTEELRPPAGRVGVAMDFECCCNCGRGARSQARALGMTQARAHHNLAVTRRDGVVRLDPGNRPADVASRRRRQRRGGAYGSRRRRTRARRRADAGRCRSRPNCWRASARTSRQVEPLSGESGRAHSRRCSIQTAASSCDPSCATT